MTETTEHRVTVTPGKKDGQVQQPATAVCSAGDWDGTGELESLKVLAANHRAGADVTPDD